MTPAQNSRTRRKPRIRKERKKFRTTHLFGCSLHPLRDLRVLRVRFFGQDCAPAVIVRCRPLLTVFGFHLRRRGYGVEHWSSCLTRTPLRGSGQNHPESSGAFRRYVANRPCAQIRGQDLLCPANINAQSLWLYLGCLNADNRRPTGCIHHALRIDGQAVDGRQGAGNWTRTVAIQVRTPGQGLRVTGG